MASLGDYISFTITNGEKKETYSNNTLINLKLTNVTNTTIFISEPTCFGVYIIPFMKDSNGLPLPLLFRIRAKCTEVRKRLLPSESYESPFIYSLNECFDFSTKGTYFLQFTYSGHIYDTDGNELVLEESLESNVVQIIIN